MRAETFVVIILSLAVIILWAIIRTLVNDLKEMRKEIVKLEAEQSIINSHYDRKTEQTEREGE